MSYHSLIVSMFFIGRLLGPTDFLLFNDEIECIIFSEIVVFRKKGFSLVCWRNLSNYLFESLVYALVYSAILLK